MQQQLNLDEALVSINNTLTDEGVRLLYQLEECQGCPLVTIKQIPKLSHFDIRVTTKYQVNLQLRDNVTGEHICNWQETFNDRGHYALDIIKSPISGKACLFNARDEGNCALCPLVLLLMAIFFLFALESLSMFIWGEVKKRRQPIDSGIRDNKEANIISEPVKEGNIQEEQEAQMGDTIQEVASQDRNRAGLEGASLDDQVLSRQGATSREDLANLVTRSNNSRVESLDIFRGLTITGMIFVNYGGAGYAAFEHSVWDGVTLADFVFPFFIFILGYTVPISIRSLMRKRMPAHRVLWKIVTRSILLFAIGLCLNSMSLKDGNLHNLRIPGVLQRFSISYLAVAITYYISALLQRTLSQHCPRQISQLVLLSASFEIVVSLAWLSIYLFYTFVYEYDPSCPIGYTGPGGISEEGRYYNCTGGAASYIDRYFLGENHLHRDHEVKDMYLTNVSHDPEGILGCSTSILLAVIGLQCGKILIGCKTHRNRLAGWSQWILITGLLSGLAFFIPINKRLWSLTFVATSALMAILLHTLLYVVIDVLKIRQTLLIRLFSSAGKNPLFLYVAHSMCSKMIPWYFAVDENSHAWLLVRLTWATILWLLIAHWMASRSIMIKI